MSFLNTIKGLGRSSKKTKKELESPTGLYTHSNASGSSLKRSTSPSKHSSPSRSQRYNNFQHLAYSRQSSPTRRSGRLPVRQQNPVPDAQESANTQPPLFLCEPFVKTALVKGSYKTIVQLPKYVEFREWIALNIFEQFNNLNQCHGVISEFCTQETCPVMNAGPKTTYLWIDSSGNAVNLPAYQYIDYVLTWISAKLNDQSVFPTKNGGAFPPTSMKDCKNIVRQMFRVFALIYHNHFEQILHLSLEAHWNSFFAHFISFVKEYELIDRLELSPLLPLVENFEAQGKII